jgi:phosphatidate cytidylyltransferase
MLCAIVRILMQENGRFFILIPFTIAFISDSFAYLTGVKFGKHKLSPTISPNKSIEGVLGGISVTIIGMVIYGLVLQLCFGFQVNYFFVVIYAVFGAAVGVFGDLCFSVIKRQTGIKDYGNIIPGHGGILDRFDSMILVAPFVEFLLFLMPLATKGGSYDKVRFYFRFDRLDWQTKSGHHQPNGCARMRTNCRLQC